MVWDETLQLFKELTEAPGAPGFEGPVREILARRMAPLADRVYTDNLGSLVAEKRGTTASPRVMIAGHMDEVGFLVTRITDEGFLKFQPLGGWWSQVLLAQRVQVITRNGPIEGVIGSVPPHILPEEKRKKPVEIKDMFIDVGATSREEAESFGIRPGDPVVPICPFTVMKNEKLLMAKAWDNRIGCAVAALVLQELKDKEHPNTVYAVGTVQEEVGLRGAQTSANLIEPDVAFAVDVGIAGDTPGVSKDEALAKLGGGPQVLIVDATLIPHTGLRDLVIDTAKELGIPIQFDAMPGGGTDAGRFHLQGQGVPSIAISIPTRYIHSHAAILHRDDVERTVRLLVALIQRLDAKTVAKLKAY